MKRDDAGNQELADLYRKVSAIEKKVCSFARLHAGHLSGIHPKFRSSAQNFLFYLGLRQLDLKDVQLRLSYCGLSSLGRSESFVASSIQALRARLSESLRGRGEAVASGPDLPALRWPEAEKILHQNSRALLGPKPAKRHVYIMATAPSAAEAGEDWAKEMLLAGMNILRINCAHEGPKEWRKTAMAARRASRSLKVPLRILVDLGGPKLRVDAPEKIKVREGDEIRLLGSEGGGRDWVACSLPEALRFVRIGHRVLFDDGKIEAKVIRRVPGGWMLRITRAGGNEEAAKLKREKGINFPDSEISVPELSPDDFSALKEVHSYADIIGLSFAQSPRTITQLRKELRRLTRRSVGLVLKIETKTGFHSLPRLLLEGMRGFPLGVMIARGDLAVEGGFERLVELQEEILWLCEAAHVPVIWATQVLEGLAKTGQPSRAEISDAGLGVRAECVMLNKGPYILEAISALDDILRRMEQHVYKKRSLYRALKVAKL